jgi:hypothetical protein
LTFVRFSCIMYIMKAERIAGGALATALLLSGCGSEAGPDKTIQEVAAGTPGTTITIEDSTLARLAPAIQKGLHDIYDAGYCKSNVAIYDLQNHPDLANVPGRGAAAGRGFAGGDLYIAGDIQPAKEQLNIEHLTAHEGLHACVQLTRKIEPVRLPNANFDASYVDGFSLEDKLSRGSDQQGVSSMDEAAVEWLTTTVASNEANKDTGYGQIAALFGSLVAKSSISANEVAALHRESDLQGMVRGITGETASKQRIGCVLFEFHNVMVGQEIAAQAYQNIQNC